MKLVLYTLLLLSFFLPGAVQAYVGPGVGLTAIGTVLAFVGTLLLLLVGFVWYPLKRLLRYFKVKQTEESHSDSRRAGSDGKDEF